MYGIKKFLFSIAVTAVLATVIYFVPEDTLWYKFVYWWVVVIAWIMFGFSVLLWVIEAVCMIVKQPLPNRKMFDNRWSKLSLLIRTAIWVFILPMAGMPMALSFLIISSLKSQNSEVQK